MNIKTTIHKHPISAYFILTFFISWLGASIMIAPKLLSGRPVPTMTGILMFPVMLLGPLIAGITLSVNTGGKSDLRKIWAGMTNLRVPFKFYIPALIIPPLSIIIVLSLLSRFISPAFSPNFFPIGLFFGIPAGIIEETGWTGFAYPQMIKKSGVFKSAIVLGFLWGLWHIPVINFLGFATPHGPYLFAFAVSFILAMAAMRVIMCLLYAHTRSIFIVQLMHIVSTSSLVVLGANHVSPKQEATWYGLYAVFLWIIVSIICINKSPRDVIQSGRKNI